jgi:ABC-type sugar transport system permease subunit
MLLFVIFHVFPFFWALWLSLVSGDIVAPDKPFVGLQNYSSLPADAVTI